MEIYPHIWHLMTGDSEWGEPEGWYFGDESEQFNGPYRSAIEAVMALDYYVAYCL
jgi:hypothetical protein